MKNVIPAAALCLVLAAASAFGQDADADTRFHRAYEQEVIEGKTADAARVYLAMMDDAKVPERLRQEAKFRFAVTATLLGRADEARAHFAELAKDPKAPETLRARAAEYLDATKAIGVGSELDKKLQSLLFELAKTPPETAQPPVYRDFEVIGRPAAPFLKQLLTHGDVSLRRHAFHLLLRLREPGMAELWTPELNIAATIADLSEYLARSPEETATFEKRVLALDDKALASAASAASSVRPTVSPSFLRAVAARKAYAVVQWLETIAWKDEALQALRVEWIRGDDDALAAAATLSFLRAAPAPVKEAAVADGLFPIVMKRLLDHRQAWQPAYWTTPNGDGSAAWQTFAGFRFLAQKATVAADLDAFEATLVRIEREKPEQWFMWTGYLDGIGLVLDERKPQGEELVRYAALLRRQRDLFAHGFQGAMNNADIAHAGAVLAGLPIPQAAEFATLVWSQAAQTPELDWSPSLPARDPARIEVCLAAYKAAPSKWKPSVMAALGLQSGAGNRPPAREFARALLAALPEFIRVADAAPDQQPPIWGLGLHLMRLPPDEARERFVAVATALAEWHAEKTRRDFYSILFERPEGDTTSRYWTQVVLPSMDGVWTAVPADDRDNLCAYVLKLLKDSSRDAELRAAVAKVVTAHLDDLPPGAAYTMAANADLFPPATWVPRTAESQFTFTDVVRPKEIADAAAREMTKDPAAVNGSVLVFIRGNASQAVKVETFDRLLRTMPADQLRRLHGFIAEGGAEAQEEALGHAMSVQAPDLRVVADIIRSLAKLRPSERLFPAVRLLLAAPEYEYVGTGISAATSLGREELLPSLATALDSLDPNVRQEAKTAIDSIVALRKLKEEARRSAGK